MEVEALEPALGAAFEALLLRDAGGEDVRVAMLTNLRDHLTRHTPHTPITSS